MKRNNFRKCAAAFVAIVALFLSISAAQAAPQHIAGRVINGTREGAPAPNARIRLLRLNQSTGESQLVGERTSGPDGRFDFGKVEAASDDMLFVRSNWQGQSYMAPAFDGANQLPLGIKVKSDDISAQVFDASRNVPGLVFRAQHIAISTIEGDDKKLKCIERMVVENPTKTTFVGGGKEGVTVVLPLPKGATDVKLDPKTIDGKLVHSGTVYGVAKPILPQLAGQLNAIIVEYTVPFNRGAVDLSRKLQYPARFFFVAREERDKSLVVTAPKLGKDKTEPLPIGGQTQNRIVNSVGQPMAGTIALPAGTDVAISVQRPTKPLVWGFVAFVGALVLAVPLTLLRSRFTGNRAPVKMAEPLRAGSVNARVPFAPPLSLALDQQTLVENLARLDDDFEAGQLERGDYVRRRAEMKHLLLEKMSAAARET